MRTANPQREMTATATKRQRPEVSSPSAVHEEIDAKELEYAESPKWEIPTGDHQEEASSDRAVKRTKLSEEERKARHREVQRRFMERKLQRLDSMRKEVEELQLRYSLTLAIQEEGALKAEQEDLRWRLRALPPSADVHGSVAAPTTCPSDAYATHGLPWDQIFDAVSDAPSTIV